MAWLFVALQRLLPQHLLSRTVGALANARAAWFKRLLIKLFVAVFGVDVTEAASGNPADYPNFNAFFTRSLKPGARPIEGQVSSPADGTVSMSGRLDGNQLIQAKGLGYSLEKLIAGPEAASYKNGSFLTVYLSPKDYHRVHIPVSGSLKSARYVPGRLFSVNSATTRLVPDLFAANERLVMHFDTALGPMAVVMVGAMIVAGIKTVWRNACYAPRKIVDETFDEPVQFLQGDELGHFEMGSTVIVIFQKTVDWCSGEGDKVLMGQSLSVEMPGK